MYTVSPADKYSDGIGSKCMCKTEVKEVRGARVRVVCGCVEAMTWVHGRRQSTIGRGRTCYSSKQDIQYILVSKAQREREYSQPSIGMMTTAQQSERRAHNDGGLWHPHAILHAVLDLAAVHPVLDVHLEVL
jgi:hypothetical protein